MTIPEDTTTSSQLLKIKNFRFWLWVRGFIKLAKKSQSMSCLEINKSINKNFKKS